MYYYHLISKKEWDQVKDFPSYSPPSLAKEGFIHMSTEVQVPHTAKRIFPGRTDMLVLKIDPARLLAEVKVEPADGDHFPHLFGPLNRDAVVEVNPLLLS